MLEKVEGRLTVEAVNGQAVPLMCRHCQEPACVDACMTGAMQKDPVSGIVTNEGNEQACVGCWMCVMACPYGLVWPRRSDQQIAYKCDRCAGKEIPACVASCPNNALFFEEGNDFAGHRTAQLAKSLVEGLVRAG
jgi:carbon-monoxide dehydrogenase iron sulfur subunit